MYTATPSLQPKSVLACAGGPLVCSAFKIRLDSTLLSLCTVHVQRQRKIWHRNFNNRHGGNCLWERSRTELVENGLRKIFYQERTCGPKYLQQMAAKWYKTCRLLQYFQTLELICRYSLAFLLHISLQEMYTFLKLTFPLLNFLILNSEFLTHFIFALITSVRISRFYCLPTNHQTG